MIHVFKRYQSRKLYDVFNNCYSTLAVVKQLILDDKAVLIVDSNTKQDITMNMYFELLISEVRCGNIKLSSQLTQARIKELLTTKEIKL